MARSSFPASPEVQGTKKGLVLLLPSGLGWDGIPKGSRVYISFFEHGQVCEWAQQFLAVFQGALRLPYPETLATSLVLFHDITIYLCFLVVISCGKDTRDLRALRDSQL